MLGRVFSGLLFGILLARTFSGIIGAALGWRAVFAIACVMMIFCALLIRWRLAESQPTSTLTWPIDPASNEIADVARASHVARRLLYQHADVLHLLSILDHALVFFLESPTYHYGSRVAGLFGLVGAAGALCAPFVGHFADRYGARRNVLASLFINIVAWVVMWLWGTHLAGLVVGVILLDIAAQANACIKPDPYVRAETRRKKPAEHGVHDALFHRRLSRLLHRDRVLVQIRMDRRVCIFRSDDAGCAQAVYINFSKNQLAADHPM